MNYNETRRHAQHLTHPAPSAELHPTFSVAINPYFVGKLAKDAPDDIWSAFNRNFQHFYLSITEIATHISHGHALTARCRGKRKTENFIARQDLGADFDTEDDRSRLDTLQAHPFISQHGAILHTTSSHRPDAPRARVLFMLDKLITDAAQYSEYAQALIWYFGTSDTYCKEAVRVWFGAQGCEMRILGNVLPCSVMDDLVTQWKAAQPPPGIRPATSCINYRRPRNPRTGQDTRQGRQS